MADYQKVLGDTENVISTNFRFRTKNHSVVTSELTKKHSLYRFPKRIVQAGGIHTLALLISFNFLVIEDVW